MWADLCLGQGFASVSRQLDEAFRMTDDDYGLMVYYWCSSWQSWKSVCFKGGMLGCKSYPPLISFQSLLKAFQYRFTHILVLTHILSYSLNAICLCLCVYEKARMKYNYIYSRETLCICRAYGAIIDAVMGIWIQFQKQSHYSGKSSIIVPWPLNKPFK